MLAALYLQKKTQNKREHFMKISLCSSEDFTLLCEVWDSINTQVTHTQTSFARNSEEQRRLQANYSHPQKPDCCNSATSSLCTKSGPGPGIVLPPGRSPQSHPWLTIEHKVKTTTVWIFLLVHTFSSRIWEKQVGGTLCFPTQLGLQGVLGQSITGILGLKQSKRKNQELIVVMCPWSECFS